MDYLATQGLQLEQPFNRTTYTFPRETTERFCIFFDKENRRCLVHPVKPETCNAGPITFDINRQTGKIEWFIKTEKICPLAGVLYNNKKALKKHLCSAKKKLHTLVNELEAKELSTLLLIREPDTFKIDENLLKRDILEQLQAEMKYKLRLKP